MADAIKPSSGGDVAPRARPEKPDEGQYKADLAKAEKEHAAVQEDLNAIKAKISLVGPTNKDSPVAKKQQELRSELSSIREKQQAFKSSRTSQQDKIGTLDATLKSKITEQKTARGRVSFKNVEEVDRQIKRLEEQVDTGTMKLVDEKKALAEITGLRKQRKQFAGFDDSQKEIDDIKVKISELKKEREHPEEKASRDRYSEIQKELDSIKAEHDETYKNLNALRDERTRIHGVQQEKYAAIRTLKDKYFKAKREFKDYEDAAWKARKERQKAERDAFEKEKRRKIADRKMEEARNPAYTDEILTAEGLIRYFDPSAAVSNTTTEPGKFAAQAQRTVDDSGIRGTRRLKKDEQEDNYFVGTGGKKGKKGKKGQTANSPTSSAPTEGGKFNLSIGIIEELAKVGAEPPMNQSDVPSVVEKLKEKLESWKKDQKSKTEENIEKAQKEIDRLEKEALETSVPSPPPKTNKGRTHHAGKKSEAAGERANGDESAEAGLAHEEDAETDVTEEIEKTSLEETAE